MLDIGPLFLIKDKKIFICEYHWISNVEDIYIYTYLNIKSDIGYYNDIKSWKIFIDGSIFSGIIHC